VQPTVASFCAAVMGHALAEEGRGVPKDVPADLRDALEDARAISDIGAYAIAVGMLGDPEAREPAREQLERTDDDLARGYVCVALGLLDDVQSIGELQELAEGSRYRPELLRRVAIGLGLLGDKSAVHSLVRMLRDAGSYASHASLASALALIGDARSVDPLLDVLRDASLTESARSFAAVAVGGVCDRRLLPWNAELSAGIHYGARTPTLISGGVGDLGVLELF